MRRLLGAAAMLGAMVAGPRQEARADIVASSGGGLGATVAPYFAQSFTTASGSPETNIRVNLFTYALPTMPYAVGTGFLLSQVYTGVPADLGTSTAGYLGSATASGGFYSFGSSVTLTGGTQYYFYENGVIPRFGVAAVGHYSGGNSYAADSATSSYIASDDSLNFVVTGNVVPEPASLAMVGLGLAGVGLIARRRTARN